MTPTKQNCDQTQLKGLNIKSAVSVNTDVFNRRFLTQFPKVALEDDLDLSRYCETECIYISYIVCNVQFYNNTQYECSAGAYN